MVGLLGWAWDSRQFEEGNSHSSNTNDLSVSQIDSDDYDDSGSLGSPSSVHFASLIGRA